LAQEAVITLKAPLWIWSGENASWHFISVPEELSGEIRAHSMAALRGFGSVKVEARIGGVSWRTSVFPVKSGGYLLPVKAEVRRKAGIAVGDDVALSLELL
jgi:hypothetical protein